jgi:hypothetical protein
MALPGKDIQGVLEYWSNGVLDRKDYQFFVFFITSGWGK